MWGEPSLSSNQAVRPLSPSVMFRSIGSKTHADSVSKYSFAHSRNSPLVHRSEASVPMKTASSAIAPKYASSSARAADSCHASINVLIVSTTDASF